MHYSNFSPTAIWKLGVENVQLVSIGPTYYGPGGDERGGSMFTPGFDNDMESLQISDQKYNLRWPDYHNSVLSSFRLEPSFIESFTQQFL